MLRPILLALLPLSFAGCVTAHPITLGSDHPANPSAAAAPQLAATSPLDDYRSADRFAAPPARAAANPGAVQVAHDGHDDAHGVGVVNSVNAAAHKVNLTHEPIPSLGWPSMTMDFDAAPKLDLSKVKPGDRVNFTIEKGQTGIYELQGIQPAVAK